MPAPETVSLQRATPDADTLLRNLLELYIHDLSDGFPVEIGPDGRFGYEKLSLYWLEPAQRHPFLIKVGGRVAGFVLATQGLPANDNPADLDVAEFFVLRAYRRSGVGRQAAIALWDSVPGRWVVRVSESNRGGRSFWTEVIHAYTGGTFHERIQDGPTRWRVFTFASSAGLAPINQWMLP